MQISKKNYLIVFILLIIILLFYFFKNQYFKNNAISTEPIIVNLLTSVHPNLPWSFQPLKPKLFIKPGEVTTVEYMVENLDNKILKFCLGLHVFKIMFIRLFSLNSPL